MITSRGPHAPPKWPGGWRDHGSGGEGGELERLMAPARQYTAPLRQGCAVAQSGAVPRRAAAVHGGAAHHGALAWSGYPARRRLRDHRLIRVSSRRPGSARCAPPAARPATRSRRSAGDHLRAASRSRSIQAVSATGLPAGQTTHISPITRSFNRIPYGANATHRLSVMSVMPSLSRSPICWGIAGPSSHIE